MERTCLALAFVLLLAVPLGAEEPPPPSPWGDNPPPRKLEPTPAPPSSDEEPAPDGLSPQELRKRFRRFSHWISIDEEDAEDPPLLTLQLGAVYFVSARTDLRFGSGSSIRDAEQEVHLREESGAPWGEITIGDLVRAGASALWWERERGAARPVDQAFQAPGVSLQPGDYAQTSFSYLHADGFVEWDVLFGRGYRIGLVGGVRYTRVRSSVRAISLQPLGLSTARGAGEVISPFFGGLVELTPTPYFTVYTKIQFIDWSWHTVGLREQRVFEARIGAAVYLVPGITGLAADFRVLSTSASPDDILSDSGHRIRYDLDGMGIGLSLFGRF